MAPTRFTASLEEPPLAEDPTSGQRDEQLPSYNACSINGTVSGERVYVNDGVPAALAQRGTGYGVKTTPGVREAIEQRDWPLATASTWQPTS